MIVRDRNFQAVAVTQQYDHGRHNRFVAALLAGVFALALVLAACSAPPAPTEQPAPSAPQPIAPVPMPPETAAPLPAPPIVGGPPGAVAPDAVDAAMVQFTSEGGTIKAYQARPKSGGPFPGLIVIHENRGLTDHIKDVARRFANQGYAALAVDLLSRVGGTDQFPATDAAVAAIGKLDTNGVTQDLNAAVKYLKEQRFVRADRIGVIGYCWGGGNSLRFATNSKDLRAAVVYYGPNPASLDDVANITASVLGIYGELDTRLTVNVPTLAEAMKKHGKSFEYKVYPGAAHAFFNDTGERHNREAAAAAWPLTLAFLEKNLKQ